MIRLLPGQPELEYAFKHALIQEAAYSGLLRRQRQQFHRQTAEALERLYPQRQEDLLGVLAYHWERSDEPQRAVDYLLRAGDRERLAYTQPEATDYYRRCLALLQAQGDDEGAARVLLRLGLTYAAALDYEQARPVTEQAARLTIQRQARGRHRACPGFAAEVPGQAVDLGLCARLLAGRAGRVEGAARCYNPAYRCGGDPCPPLSC